MDVLVAFAAGLQDALSFPNFLYILLGVGLGLFLGVVPGLGGIVGLTVLLPLTFTLDIGTALAMMIALLAVTTISDTIPAVLLGVPGTSAAAATVVDGFPMAKKGEAAKALGAAFASSAIGGVLGAMILALSIPLVRPIAMAFGPPEIFMLAMLGLMTVGMMGGNDPLRGWAAAGLGVMIAMIGREPTHATPRFTFEQTWLWDGLPVIAVALGLFALPELIDLSRRNSSISKVELPKNLWAGQLEGIRSVFQNWFLVLRCSALGVWVGFLPGLGANVCDWIAYAHGQTSSRNNETFGKGDVRGVIAPEAATNSCKGGELIPTLAFGVPGSLSMAVLFGAMLIAGISPGRQLLNERLDLTMLMIWSLVVANILGTLICLGFTRYLARLTELPGYLIVAVVGPIVIVSTFAFEAVTAHVPILIGMGLLGYFMRQFRWPRPPLLVGFVLGAIVENNLVNSVRLFGWEFLLRPVTMVITVLLVLVFVFGVFVPIRRQVRKNVAKRALKKMDPKVKATPRQRDRLGLFAFEAFLFLVMAYTLLTVLTAPWRFHSALMPMVFALFGTLMTGAVLLRGTLGFAPEGNPEDELEPPFIDTAPTALLFFTWIIGAHILTLAIGFMPAMVMATLIYMTFFGKPKPIPMLLSAAVVFLIIYLVYERLMHVSWPQPWLFG